MKTKSPLESAFFHPRALIGFGFGAIGLLLGLVAFIALPKQSALAIPSPCTAVEYTFGSGDIPGAVYVTMESHNEGTATQCTIYFTVSAGLAPTPTHSSDIYTDPYPVLSGQIRRFKAFGHKLYAIPEDSGITSVTVNNTVP
ncbi:MAG TPA: hypothetical protein VNP98_02495 [Chthoniobacterales bacterium]|nr:hypothetical protein [Chthoniobacterales bacterium]